MTILSKAWNNFKTQPDVWFFYGFLLTFALSVRKVLFFYPINVNFNEYTGIYLYLSDIFLVATLFLWATSILCDKNAYLSIDIVILWLKQAINYLPLHQKHGITRWWTAIKKYVACKLGNRNVSFWCGGVPLLLVFWSFITILWSENQNIALFRAIKLLEFFLLYSYIVFKIAPILSKSYFDNCHPELDSGSKKILDSGSEAGMTFLLFFQIFIALGFIQAIIGIGQFLLQHSIGLFWLKESLISPDAPGVAKIILDGEKYIRAYGLFPHPNILGGFLLVSIILTWGYSKLFHPGRNVPCGTSYGAGVEQFSLKQKFTQKTVLLVQIIALALTFSKSAIIGLLIAILYILWKNKKMFHVEHLGKKAIIIAIILILSLYLVGLNFDENLDKSVSDRIDQFNVSRETILDNIWIGLGQGQYILNLANVPRGTLENWQYQPIHNVFLLILSELGFVGVFIFILFLWKILRSNKNVPRLPRETEMFHMEHFGFLRGGILISKGILLGFIFIMLFDHYLWDIQQGQIMLWIVLGMTAGLARK